MKLKNIEIQGVGGISKLSIDLDPRMNILCGPNGVGKTTVIEAIGHLFSLGSTTLIKRQALSPHGYVAADLLNAPNDQSRVQITLATFEPDKEDHIQDAMQLSQFIFSLKASRTLAYQPLQAVSRDTEKPIHVLVGEAARGIGLTDLKNWFVNRYLYSAHDTLRGDQLANFALAKSCFSALNPDFNFSRVDPATNEILVTTPTGEIYYEYLSSGFKSCIAILFGIIKEVEFRFAGTRAASLEAVVLIDELELHLHPDWQSRIASVLTDLFQEAQFIVSTHSPHVVQAAKPKTIVALEWIEGAVRVRELPDSPYGFAGWTVEEVLEDVMGMRDTRTAVFNRSLALFESAIDEDRPEDARLAYDQLERLLHPNNPTRKLLRMQLAGLLGRAVD